MTGFRVNALILVLVAPMGIAKAQDAVRLRIGGHVGESLQMVGLMRWYDRAQPASVALGDTWSLRMSSTSYSTRTLIAMAGDTAVFSEVVDSMSTELPGIGELPRRTWEPSGRLTMTTKVSPFGRILSAYVSGTPSPRGDSIRAAMTQKVSHSGNAALFPERPVRVGESWVDTGATPVAGGTSGSRITAFHLDSLNSPTGDTIAVISFRTVYGQVDSAIAGTRIYKGELRFDVSHGWMVGMRTTSVTSRVTPQGEEQTKVESATFWLGKLVR